LDPYRRQDLIEGHVALLIGLGYGGLFLIGCNHWTESQWEAVKTEMRADWQKHQAELIAAVAAERPGHRPWAWWEFEAPERRQVGETQPDYLERLKLWIPGERDRYARCANAD
jgi:hypothetical protein